MGRLGRARKAPPPSSRIGHRKREAEGRWRVAQGVTLTRRPEGGVVVVGIPTPSLLLGVTAWTGCHGEPKRTTSADWAPWLSVRVCCYGSIQPYTMPWLGGQQTTSAAQTRRLSSPCEKPWPRQVGYHVKRRLCANPDGQESRHDEPLPVRAEIRVRMGLDTGEVEGTISALREPRRDA